ncbi:MAG: PadR family transcriptional regulator [Bryobacteraceae bacterium]|nr:PadR family transcriptional regulator [Bryobacteraceae bacterium]
MYRELLPGTLDLLVLKSLAKGPLHGYGIGLYLRQVSGDLLQVGEGSLYPALQRLVVKGWASAKWGVSETGRKARFYELTGAGKEQLASESAEFDRMVNMIQQILRTA